MNYRITLDLTFPDRDPVDDIYDKVMDYIEEAITINPGTPNEEPPSLIVQICYHDEQTHQVCQVIHQWPS